MSEDTKLGIATIIGITLLFLGLLAFLTAERISCYEAAKVNHELRCDK